MKRMVSFFLATVLLITCTVSLAGNVSAKGLSQHVQVTSYDPNMDYTAAIQQALEDGSAYALQVGAIYEQQRNLKIRDLKLDLEETNYFQEYGTVQEILQAMEEASKPKYTQEELDLLARVIYAEVGCTWIPDWVQQMVGSVVLNRVEDSRFPDTVKGVITQPGQYSTKYATVEAANAIQATDSKNGTYYYGICEDSVKAAMMGQVEMPSNVLYQANFSQGKGVWKSVYFNSGWYASTSYFCYG